MAKTGSSNLDKNIIFCELGDRNISDRVRRFVLAAQRQYDKDLRNV
jgi:hypothetical protein